MLEGGGGLFDEDAVVVEFEATRLNAGDGGRDEDGPGGGSLREVILCHDAPRVWV